MDIIGYLAWMFAYCVWNNIINNMKYYYGIIIFYFCDMYGMDTRQRYCTYYLMCILFFMLRLISCIFCFYLFMNIVLVVICKVLVLIKLSD